MYLPLTVSLTKAFVLAAVVAKVQPSDEALVLEVVNRTTYAIGCVNNKKENIEQIEHIGTCVHFILVGEGTPF